jgi:hypothetical protein
VFENRVLRRIFGPKRDEVTGEWRTLHNEELRGLYSSPSIIRMIKSRRTRLAGHVARMGGRGTHMGYWWETREKETTKKIKIKMYLGDRTEWMSELIWLRLRPSGGLL